MVGILIVDECPMVRAGCKGVLGFINGVTVIGKAASGEAALRLAVEMRPDLILIEPNFSGEESSLPRRAKMPEMELCRELKHLPFSPKVIIYTAHNYPADVAAAILAEADGYIHKSVQEERLEKAIEDALADEEVWLLGLSQEQTQYVMRSAAKVAGLSRREKEVLPLVLGRYSSKEMGMALRVEHQSAQNHVSHILHKLGYKSRQELYEAWGV